MTQSEVRALVEKALDSSMHAYWAARDPEIQKGIMDAELPLHDVYTQLMQDGIESRDADFQAAATVMKDTVLPAIKKLDASVGKLVKTDDVVKTALTDMMKLSMSASFFKIPSIPTI